MEGQRETETRVVELLQITCRNEKGEPKKEKLYLRGKDITSLAWLTFAPDASSSRITVT